MSDLWHLLECECNPGFRYASLMTFGKHFESLRHRHHQLLLRQRHDDIEKRRAENKIRMLGNKIREKELEKETVIREHRQEIERLENEWQQHRQEIERLENHVRYETERRHQDIERLENEHKQAIEQFKDEQRRLGHKHMLRDMTRLVSYRGAYEACLRLLSRSA